MSVKARHLIVLLNLGLVLIACSGVDYASFSKEVNRLLAKDIGLTAEDKTKVMALREEGERLNKEGKTQESLEALGVFADMKFIGEYYQPDLALLPIGGHFTMDPKHAAYAVRNLLKTKTVMPIHYGTFKPLKGTPEEFAKALGDFPSKVVVLQPGDTKEF
jgi:hypothetical protein